MLEYVPQYRPWGADGASVLAELVADKCACLVMFEKDTCVDAKRGAQVCFKIYKDQNIAGPKVVRGRAAYNRERRHALAQRSGRDFLSEVLEALEGV